MKSLVAAILAVWMSMPATFAQRMLVPGTQPSASAFGPDPIVQITTTFQARIEGLTDPRSVPPTTAQDGARRSIYNMAANECTVLAEFWKAECRLNSLSLCIYSPCVSDAAIASIDGRDVQLQVPSMFGTAVYELRLTSLPAR